MNEVYKNVNDYYSVSNLGNVKSLRSGKLLKPRVHTQGYLTVCFSVNGKHEYKYIHRLVGELFLENFKKDNVINHKNCNKEDNSVYNLESVSQIQDIQHSVENDLHCKGNTHGRRKLNQNQINDMRNTPNKDLTKLAKIYKVSKATISRILNNKIWTNTNNLIEEKCCGDWDSDGNCKCDKI